MSKPRGKHAAGAKQEIEEAVAPEQQAPAEEQENAVVEDKAVEGKPVEGKTEVLSESVDPSEERILRENEPAQQPGFVDIPQQQQPYNGPHVQSHGIEAYRREAYGSGGYQPRPEVPNLDANGQGSYVVGDYDAMKVRKRRKGLKAFGITVGVIAAVLAVVYIAGAVVFMGRFMPGTVLGSHDVSMKTDQEVSELLNNTVKNYQLDVIGNGFSYRATGSDLGLSIDSDGILRGMHQDQNAWAWPALMLSGKHDETSRMTVSFNPATYEQQVSADIAKFNETATPPTNATIVYNDSTDKFEVQPEQIGTQLNTESVMKSISDAITALESKVSIGSDNLLKPTILASDPKLTKAAEQASAMVAAKLTLIMSGQPVGEVNGDSISPFITINENFDVVFKEDEMNGWIEGLVANYNTVGTERTFTRADGKVVTVPAGGVYGWEVDNDSLKAAIIEGVKAGKTEQIEVPCLETAAVYAGPNQRDWGPRYIDVDLSEQHVRFYGDDGSIIWEADCISGTPDGEHDTGVGMWYVNNKESPSKLIGYERGRKIYETTVKYWMAFEYNGIGFHDATWQPGFGGSMYANGYGSHGCVNLSYGDAQSLYDIVQVGDPVAVHF